MTRQQMQTVERIATDSHGAKCAACGKEWRVWYVDCRVIARIKCRCER